MVEQNFTNAVNERRRAQVNGLAFDRKRSFIELITGRHNAVLCTRESIELEARKRRV